MLLSPKQFLTGIALVWGIVATLALIGWNPLGITWLLGAPILLVFPGYLICMSMRMPVSHRGVSAVLMVALSILFLMALFFAGNWILLRLGVMRPLDTLPAVLLVSVFLFVLSAFAYPTLKSITFRVPRYLCADTVRDAFLMITPLLLVLLAGVGAVTLNAGGSGLGTMVMLGCTMLFSGVLAWRAPQVREWVVSVSLSLVALALLLMTSLRGWFISGHDIQREFFVFQLAKDAGRWSMEAYVDAYNACLSITILPTVLSNLLQIPDAYVYKVLMQVLFACSVMVVYAIASRMLSARRAVLATLLFVSFPTFFQDMPFLVRQEIAFLFFGVMLYVLFFEYMKRWKRILIVSLMGIGVVLSHYSTTYVVIAVLGIAYATYPVVHPLYRYVATRFKRGSVIPYRDDWRRVTFWLLAVLTVSTLLWVSFITGSDGHTRTVVGSVWSAVRGEGDSTRSLDIALVFGFGRVESEATMDRYVNEVVTPRRNSSPAEFYATSTYDAYPLVTLPKTELPLTPKGVAFRIAGYDIAHVVVVFGGVLAKVMQVSVIVGMLCVLWSKRFVRFTIPLTYYLLASASVVFVVACMVLPILSVEYGVLRAFLQSLFVLAPFMVVGILALMRAGAWIVRRPLSFLRGSRAPISITSAQEDVLAFGCVALIFLYTTGFITQLTGGNIPAMHLNNVGDDYKQYVTEPSEHAAIMWLKIELEREYAETGAYPLVQSDRLGEMKLQAYLRSRVGGDIYPGSIHRDAYVFLTPAIRYGGVATVRHEGALIKYAYMPQFLEEHKSLVYSNGDVHIYR